MAIAKKKTLIDDNLFEINGLSIKRNATYKIENKYDANAPSGFQKERSTKIPSIDTGNTIQCPFSATDNKGGGVWNTGFYVTSACYSGLDKKVVAEKVSALQEFVVKPYEEHIGQEGQLHHNNDEFWNNYLIELWSGRYLNTSDPKEMLDLYIALMSNEVAVSGVDEGNPKFSRADFIIVDKNKERSNKQKTAIASISAVGEFYTLLNANPQKLNAILRYLGIIGASEKVDQSALMIQFQQWTEVKIQNSEEFVKLIKSMEDNAVSEAVYLYSKLKSAELKRFISKDSIGDYVYKGIPLGKDLKVIARNLINDPELTEIKAQILEQIN